MESSNHNQQSHLQLSQYWHNYLHIVCCQQLIYLKVESQPAAPATGNVTFWQAVVDSKTNHTYYWNTETNEVAWTLPPGGVIANPEVGGAGGGAEAEAEKDKDGCAGDEGDEGETIDELMENYPYSKKTVVLPPKGRYCHGCGVSFWELDLCSDASSEENVKNEETGRAVVFQLKSTTTQMVIPSHWQFVYLFVRDWFAPFLLMHTYFSHSQSQRWRQGAWRDPQGWRSEEEIDPRRGVFPLGEKFAPRGW